MNEQLSSNGAETAGIYEVGLARVDITPCEPIALGGWGGRRIATEAVHPLWAKALVLRDERGKTAVLVTTDLIGFDRDMNQEFMQRAATRFGLRREQLIINSSHSHSAPLAGELHHRFYPELHPEDHAVIERYTPWLLDQIESAIASAMETMGPCILSFEQGLCGFGVNRRRNQQVWADGTRARRLPQIVDHDVPVLAVRSVGGQLRAVVFGYACHPTTFNQSRLSSDYTGFAQLEIESVFPGAMAMFVAGCGGDINAFPRFGRYHEELTAMFGKTLAAAVCNALDGPMKPLDSALQLNFDEIELPLAPPDPTILQSLLQDARATNLHIRVADIEQYLQATKQGPVETQVPFPIHVWRIGALNFIGLPGEPVVDYALQFKEQFGVEDTWVAGYCSELMAYIPTRRVLAEGGYEGTDSMPGYGWLSPFDESVEERISTTVENLMQHNRSETTLAHRQ